MFFIVFLRFLLGYVRIKIGGKFPERFLNLCASRGVTVWNTVKTGEYIECSVSVSDYRRMHSYRKNCRATIKLVSKHGMPFFNHRHRKRIGVPVGFAMFIAYLMIMPNFIWTVEVKGNTEVDSAEILAALDNLGVRQGAYIDGIDADDIKQDLMLSVDGLSWAAINIEGTVATVDVRETVDPTIPDSEKEPCNLKAAIDGRILEIHVSQGTQVAHVGDAVIKGDILVSGLEEYTTGKTIPRHAAAIIKAETNREIEVEIEKNQIELKRTGRENTRSVLDFFGIKIPLYLGSVQYEYEKEVIEKPLEIGGVTLPIKITTAKFYEVNQKQITLSDEQAKKAAENELKKKEKELFPDAVIVKREIKTVSDKKSLKVTAKYICNEDISVEDYLKIG